MVGGTRTVSIDRDSKQRTSDLVLSKGQQQTQQQPLPNKGKVRRRSHPRQRYGIGVANFTLDRADVVIDGMTGLGDFKVPKTIETVIQRPCFGRRISRNMSSLNATSWLFHLAYDSRHAGHGYFPYIVNFLIQH